MEQFFETILKYSINLAVDRVYEGIQTELNQDSSIGAEIALVFIEKGYKNLKAELQ
ncbi:hypothetical protein [Acinetobacter sp. WCHAc060033]|uniref:hypothetical protein n=1 Tax=Acinetobacter sp. WCHAc060033 TaxID=2518624 RepID=UPI0013EE4974|nr:hypothetical protein [Acinetobacter sp. WCHAc060033]